MVSFIVIGKNEGWRLEKCLVSVRRITEKIQSLDYEIIYVDSKSTDESVSLAKRYADKIFEIDGACSAAIGRNIGAMESSGNILFFLDGDMELLEDGFLEVLDSNGHLKHPFVSGVENDVLYDGDWNFVEEKPRNSPTGMIAIEKSIFIKVGGYDNRLVRSEDSDLRFRLSSIGVPYLRLKNMWVNHYTRYYAVRSEPLSVYKYHALLTRKHLFDRCGAYDLFVMNYSFYYLVFALIASLVTSSFYAFIPYVLLIAYRTFNVLRRTGVRLNFLKECCWRVAKDVSYVYYFLTYYPDNPRISYIRIK